MFLGEIRKEVHLDIINLQKDLKLLDDPECLLSEEIILRRITSATLLHAKQIETYSSQLEMKLLGRKTQLRRVRLQHSDEICKTQVIQKIAKTFVYENVFSSICKLIFIIQHFVDQNFILESIDN